MKILSLYIFLSIIGVTHAAAPIPAREPRIFEGRPSWWLSLWMDHVLVIEGTIEWNEDRAPEIQIAADPKVIEAAIGKEDTELFQASRKFRIGRIKPTQILFASPGITSSNLEIAAIARGQIQDLKFLLPIMEVNGREFNLKAKNGDNGIFIFRYGSMITVLPLVLDEKIPKDGMPSADAVFKHRNLFDYRAPKQK